MCPVCLLSLLFCWGSPPGVEESGEGWSVESRPRIPPGRLASQFWGRKSRHRSRDSAVLRSFNGWGFYDLVFHSDSSFHPHPSLPLPPVPPFHDSPKGGPRGALRRPFRVRDILGGPVYGPPPCGPTPTNRPTLPPVHGADDDYGVLRHVVTPET